MFRACWAGRNIRATALRREYRLMTRQALGELRRLAGRPNGQFHRFT
jgi:hypothetical protein